MRIVVSTIGTLNYGISNYLVKIIQPVLNKNKTGLKNFFDFVNKASSWNINEVQVSFDVVNLYPSIPLKEATLILIDQLNKDDSFKYSTKLTISETRQLIELCLHCCYFLWNKEIHELENSSPIGLSFMVILAESFLQYHEENAFKIAMTLNPPLDLKSYLRYVDDSHARFSNIQEAEQFQTILNKQHPAIKYTIKIKSKNKTMNFLNVTIINNTKGRYEFKVYRKEAITIIQIKPHSNHDPKILSAIFKGYVHRAYSICSDLHLQKEIDFIIELFNENGYDRRQLVSIANQIRKKWSTKNNKNQSNCDALPAVTLPWIPSLSPKLRKILEKLDIE